MGAQTVDDDDVLGIVEIGYDAAGNHLADAFDLLKLFERGGGQRVHRLEMACKELGRSLSDEAYAEGEDDALEGHRGRRGDALDNLPRRFLTVSVAVDLLDAYVVEVGHVADEPLTEIVVDGLRAETVDVHGLAGYVVFDAALYLRRTSAVVRAVVGRLALRTDKLSAALRAAGDETDGLGARLTAVLVDADNLRDNLPTLLDIDIVAEVEIERTDEVFVVERRATHRRTGQLDGLHVGDGRHMPRTADLKCHLTQTGALPFGLELICDGPARTLCRIAEDALLAQ